MLTSWAVWIPVQSINMAFVPPPQRLLFVNVVSIFWNTFLALVASGGGPGESQRDEANLELGKLPSHVNQQLPQLRMEGKASKMW